VGAKGDDTETGSAYLFERNQGGIAENWGQVKKNTASDSAVDDLFGDSVSISGDTIVVGANKKNSFTGSSYIFFENLPDPCIIPSSGNMVIMSSCTINVSVAVPASVIVKSDAVMTILSGGTLDINFASFNLTVESGGGVLIKAGGTIT